MSDFDPCNFCMVQMCSSCPHMEWRKEVFEVKLLELSGEAKEKLRVAEEQVRAAMESARKQLARAAAASILTSDVVAEVARELRSKLDVQNPRTNMVFSEALEVMKAGGWVKRPGCVAARSLKDGEFVYADGRAMVQLWLAGDVLANDWEEVK